MYVFMYVSIYKHLILNANTYAHIIYVITSTITILTIRFLIGFTEIKLEMYFDFCIII